MNPWFAHQILWPLHERLRGRATRRLLRDLRASERLPPEAIEQRQVAALRRVLDHAAAATPYYRRQFERVGFDPHTIRSPSDLQRVPFLTKALVRAYGDDLIDPRARRRLSAYATSGSTGEPLQFFIDRRRTAADNAARARARAWWGVWPGDREAVLWGSGDASHPRGFWRPQGDWLLNIRMLPAAELGEDALAHMIETLGRFRPKVIFGYASALGELAEIISTGLDESSLRKAHSALRTGLRLVVATAEPLLPHHRRALAAAFGRVVATEYGARECGVLAGECPRGSLHIAAENALIEVVDPQTGAVLPPGQTGELAVTLLREYGMPMIRYRVGDVGRLAAEPCGCGLGLPVLAAVEGRRRDLLHLPGGRVVHPSVFSTALAEVRGLSRYRVVQTSPTGVVIEVCTGASEKGVGSRLCEAPSGPTAKRLPTPFSPLSLADAAAAIRRRVGPGIDVTIVHVDGLRRDGSGKFRWVIGLPEAEAPP